MKRTWILFICFSFFALPSLAYVNDPVLARQGMVVTEQKLATKVGVDILAAGGNAIDAAVAVGYALAVVYPCCGNIGGGGFMTIHLANGKDVFLNFREKAPLASDKNMYLDRDANVNKDLSIKGYLAVAVPGTVMGLDTALQKYGTMTRKEVMAPAIRLANQGYKVTKFDADWFAKFADMFRSQPSVAAIFLKNGQPYKQGELLIQKDLAQSLQNIADKGPDVFYKGDIAQAIVTASKAQGGILSMEDFANYTVQTLPPVYCNYRGYTIISSAPPSSGGVALCEILGILENFQLQETGFHSFYTTRAILEAMRYGFLDRNKKLGDPDFIKNPVKELTSKSYTKEISDQIKSPVLSKEHAQTTHYSIIDKQGNAVAVTYTLNGFFGAKVIAAPTGFFLNNEMDDFTAKAGASNQFGLVQYNANEIQPGKRPLSSMTPTVVMKDGKVFMVLGSPGGPRIITAVLLTLLNVIDFGMNVQEAVNTARFHFQGDPNVVFAEPFSFSYTTSKKLGMSGYQTKLELMPTAVEAIWVDPTTKIIQGANDWRRPDGAAIGY